LRKLALWLVLKLPVAVINQISLTLLIINLVVKKIAENTEDVLYLKADTNYTIYSLKCGGKLVSSFTLKIHQERCEYNHFIRINRSYLLNPKYIKEVIEVGSEKIVKLMDGTLAKVSRRRMHVLSQLG
jgi:DNA-binding LytR/AlgR family response regulator